MIEALRNTDSSIRRGASATLGIIGDQKAVEPLIATLIDPYYVVQEEAARALGGLGDLRAVEPLIVSLKDESVYVRRSTAEALGKMRDSRSLEPLLETPKDKDSGVRRSATKGLSMIGRPAVEPLIAALKGKDPFVRIGAAEALCQINDVLGKKLLDDGMKYEHLEIVAGGYTCYIRKGDPGTESLLAKALEKYGTKWMAEAFINSNNSKLSDPAIIWAKKHGYFITSFPTLDTSSTWGRDKK